MPCGGIGGKYGHNKDASSREFPLIFELKTKKKQKNMLSESILVSVQQIVILTMNMFAGILPVGKNNQ